jgi:hypothetical protein
MKSKLILVIIGILVVGIVALSVNVLNKKQSTSAKAMQIQETVAKTVIIKDVDTGKEIPCVMKDGVCHIYSKGTRLNISKRGR